MCCSGVSIAVSLVLASLLAVPHAASQVPDGEPQTESPSSDEQKTEEERPETTFRGEVVVTAGRREQMATETPVAVSVIDGTMIDDRQPEKITDLLTDVPGVEVQGEGPFRGIPVIRGLTSNRVLILVDGQRLNNARESTLFAGIQPGLVDLSQVERIEVVRGPASVLYGSDAMGGVLNIITEQPRLGADRLTVHGGAGYEYGSASDVNRTWARVGGSGRGFGFSVQGSWESVENYSAPDEAADRSYYRPYVGDDGTVPNSGMDQSAGHAGFRMLTGGGVLTAELDTVRTRDIGFPGYDPETSGVDISFPRFDRDKLSVRWEAGPLWGLRSVSLAGYGQRIVKESRRNIDPSPMFFQHMFTRSDIDTVGFNAQGIADRGSHHLTFGFDLNRDDLEDEALNESPWGVDTNVTVPTSRQTSYGVYVQDEARVLRQLKILAGLRYDRFQFRSDDDPDYTGDPFDVTDSDFSGTVGALYSLTDHVELTALMGRAFRAPNIQERAYNGAVSEPGYWLVQNPDLDSEQTVTTEAGFKVHYDSYFGAFTVYNNDIEDLITYVELGPDPDTGLNLVRYDNIDQATIRGVEVELQALLTAGWRMFGSYAWTHGDHDTTGEPLGFIPPWKLVIGARFEAARWWVEGRARVAGEQDRLTEEVRAAVDDGERPPVGDFTVVDVHAGCRVTDRINLRATLANALDELYSEPFNLRPDAGRSLRMSMSYSF